MTISRDWHFRVFRLLPERVFARKPGLNRRLERCKWAYAEHREDA